MSEKHLMIDWSRFHSKEALTKVIEDSGLIVDEVKTLSYSDPNIASRFYGQQVNDERFKKPLNLYLITDPSPDYRLRPTTRGRREVNVNLFDLKQKVRAMTRGQLHATDNTQETKDNMRVLGLNYHQREFNSLSDVFECLNESGVNYVVMRGYHGLLDREVPDMAFDVNILTDDFHLLASVLDASYPEAGGIYDNGDLTSDMSKKRRLIVTLRDQDSVRSRFFVDARFVGDDYFCSAMQEDMLSSRELNKGVYIPSEEYHKYALMYHEMLHKGRGCPYGEGIESLKSWMTSKGYEFVVPKDKSVSFKL